ncbi:MAG: hypothetical protein ACPGID_01935 [Rubricella sp.]
MTRHTPAREATAGGHDAAPARRRPPTGAVLLLLAGALALVLQTDLLPRFGDARDAVLASRSAVWVLLLTYMVFLCIPFVPGAEIGLALMLAFGAPMAGPVYIATVLGLSLAYGMGRMASWHATRGAGALPQAMAELATRLRGSRWIRPALRHRWLAVCVLINMPGNTILGGGGGIAMAIGYGRGLPYPAFLATVAVAVAPVPAIVAIAEATGFGAWIMDGMAGLP